MFGWKKKTTIRMALSSFIFNFASILLVLGILNSDRFLDALFIIYHKMEWNILQSSRWVRYYYLLKRTFIFLISQQKLCSRYSLEVLQWGASNEYPQHRFSLRNRKKYYIDIPSYLDLWYYLFNKIEQGYKHICIIVGAFLLYHRHQSLQAHPTIYMSFW